MADVKIFTDIIEDAALNQINTLVEQPCFANAKVRIMPDVHAGKGCVIGFTADLGDKVVPNLVGVDIGCGMYTVQICEDDVSFNALDHVIRKKVPNGCHVHEHAYNTFEGLSSLRCYPHLKEISWIERSLGTLGGGNHFIEIDRADNGELYLVIHTGSRNLGKQVAEYYQKLAIDTLSGKADFPRMQRELIEKLKSEGREKEISGALEELKRRFKPDLKIPSELAYLEGQNREDYLHDMKICQDFAHENRKEIADVIFRNMGWSRGFSFETIHNYVDFDSNIIRKGAISAKNGERVLIPINMADGCIMGIGKGNEDWNCSAPHGAGRIMSRNRARELLSVEEYSKAMSGIYTTCVGTSTLDEAPMAYKSLKDILKYIGDTVEVTRIITPIYNFKSVD